MRKTSREIDVAYARKLGDRDDITTTVMDDLMLFCHMDRKLYEGDVNTMLVNEGRRQVVLHIKKRIEKGQKDA